MGGLDEGRRWSVSFGHLVDHTDTDLRRCIAGQFVLAQGQEAAHTRIIYDVAWTPDGSVFATASRDKTVGILTGAMHALLTW